MRDTADTKTIDMLKPEPKTSAERQRTYRERKKKALHGSTKNYGESGVRLDMYISGDANLQLGSLLQYLSLQGNVTKKQLIEQLIEQEYLKHVCDFPKDLFDCED
jgi:hypothetical protein